MTRSLENASSDHKRYSKIVQEIIRNATVRLRSDVIRKILQDLPRSLENALYDPTRFGKRVQENIRNATVRLRSDIHVRIKNL